MKAINETIRSESGFYIGDVQNVVPQSLKLETRICCSGGGKWKDDARNAEAIGVHIAAARPGKSYFDQNGDEYVTHSNTLALVPLELVSATIDQLRFGRIIPGGGEATFETAGETIKITLPSTEVVEIYTGRTN